MADETPVTTTADLTTDPAAIEAELARLRQAQEQPAPPVVAPTETPPATPPAAPAAATPPADTPKPADTLEKRDGAAWQLLRKKEKLLEAKEAELADLKAKAAGQTPSETSREPTYESDPAEFLRRKTEATDAEIARLRAEAQAREYIDQIRTQETEFAKDHPDYFKASEYLLNHEAKEWEDSGIALRDTQQVLGDARYKPYVDKAKADPGVRSYAEKEGRDVDEIAAYVVARNTYLQSRRDLLYQGATAKGITVAQAAYERAKFRGYTSNGEGDAAAAAERAKVTRSREISDAVNPLSESASATPAADVRVLRNRSEILNLDNDSLDALIASGHYKEL